MGRDGGESFGVDVVWRFNFLVELRENPRWSRRMRGLDMTGGLATRAIVQHTSIK